MHELSIATSIVSTVLQEVRRRNLPRVQNIGVRIGVLSNVDPEALQFSFESIISGSPLAHTQLEIEHVPVQGTCRVCGYRFTIQNFAFVCPHCDSGQIDTKNGEELEIAYLKVAGLDELE